MHIQFKRRITHGTNVIIAVLAFFGLVVFVNYLTNKYPKRHDFIQSTDLYKLSDKTKNVLLTIDEGDQPLKFYWFSNPGKSELYDKVKRLFEAYHGETPKVEYKIINEVSDIMEAQKLVRELEIDEPDTIAIVYGDNKKLLTEMDLADFKFDHDFYTGGQIKRLITLKAEQALTSAILELMDPRKIQARFTVKHGEKSIFGYDDNGYSEANRYLARDNIEAKPIELITLSEISTTNVDILIVAGPTRKFLDHEINLIRHYLNNGGRGLFLLDPDIETGLEPLLREFNVKLGNDIVIDPAGQLPGVSPLQLVVGRYRKHPISQKLKTYTIFFLTRSVGIVNPENDVNKAVDIALTSPKGWGETDTTGESFSFDPEKDLEGAVSIAVAVENEKTGMRLVVVGDSEFATNRDFFQGANYDFFMNSVNWTIHREMLVAISPKTIAERRQLRLNRFQMNMIRTVVIFVVPGLSILAGIVVYIIRRK
jgi:hypothetical protein